MTDDFSVSPDELFSAGEQLADVSSSIKDVLSALVAQQAGYGSEAWGDDHIGDDFFNGPQGYGTQNENVQNAIGEHTGVLDFWADALKTAAKSFQQQDDQ